MTKHQICLSSSQNFYEGLSRAFRDPLLSVIEADLRGIRFLFPWQLTLAACLKRLCEGRIAFEVSWNSKKSSQNEIAAYAHQVGLDKLEVESLAEFAFNPENYSEIYPIERAEDLALQNELRRILQKSPQISRPMASAMAELADNVFHHSGQARDVGWGYVQAQVTQSRFRIAFCDLGVGHYKTYQRCRELHGRSPIEVLESSLQSSGLMRVCDAVDKSKGTMEILSDGLRCRYRQGKKVTKVLGFRTKGTLISIEIPIHLEKD